MNYAAISKLAAEANEAYLFNKRTCNLCGKERPGGAIVDHQELARMLFEAGWVTLWRETHLIGWCCPGCEDMLPR